MANVLTIYLVKILDIKLYGGFSMKVVPVIFSLFSEKKTRLSYDILRLIILRRKTDIVDRFQPKNVSEN